MTEPTMHHRIGRLFLAAALSLAALCPAAAQQLPPVPRSDVTFRTVTIRYPFDREVRVPMVGTERFGANVSGEAVVERRSSITKISLTLKRLPRPATVGPMAATYVMWAVTPEGICDNLGEYRKRQSDTLDGWFGSEISTTTRHRNFSLIVTAEPHYLVTSPSRLVVAANAEVRTGQVFVADNEIDFSGDADVENRIVSPEPPAAGRDPRYPPELLQAQRARDIARYYEADQLAPQLMAAAGDAFAAAEDLYRRGRRDEAAETADTAIRLAERARRIATARRTAERRRQELAAKDDVIAELQDRVGQIPTLQAQLDNERRLRREVEADRERLRDAYNRLAADKTQGDANTASLREEIRRLRSELDRAQAATREARIKALREELARLFGDARFEARGSVLVLPDSDFITTPRQPMALTPAAMAKLDRLVEFLRLTEAAVRIEAYSDNTGTEQSRQDFCRERGQLVLGYLTARGIPTERVQAFAMGNTNPRQPNTTPRGRTANRRVELILPPPSELESATATP
jgi:outer membrane protein OmpA-like peptidoglycan-associated protein